MEAKLNYFLKSLVKLSQLFESDSSFDQITQQILEEVGSSLRCQWGTYWQVELHHLIPATIWSKQGFTATDLDQSTKNRTLLIGEGAAGHVWRSKKPAWTLDLNRDMCLPRSLKADKFGLTGGIWFALKTDDIVYAVIELLGRQVVPPSEELIFGLEIFGVHLGKLMKKRLAAELSGSQ